MFNDISKSCPNPLKYPLNMTTTEFSLPPVSGVKQNEI
jgi:hypothetical protein